MHRLLTVTMVGWAALGVACFEEERLKLESPSATPEVAREILGIKREPAVSYVGGDACGGCHTEEASRWDGSHHDLAMQEAIAGNVLADFDDTSFEVAGQRFTFHRDETGYFVRTAGVDGNFEDFRVVFTFGVEPLQQYLVQQPGGRFHALSAAWDSRPAGQGGQRWFHLQPEDGLRPDDVLHWTGLAGRWNDMCADCHSTNVTKGYRPENRVYETTWTEMDVACEACHGPGSHHVDWVQAGTDPEVPNAGWEHTLVDARSWTFNLRSPIAERDPPTPTSRQIETCAPCHSRRARIAEGRGDFLDVFRPALLDEGLYHADGQILDEVYVWGSFVQSRMYTAGVLCSDCHDPHRLTIDEPDAICAQCHKSEFFDEPSHHHHKPSSAGSSCVACHMPAKTYMVVDDRRDHGFRVPRPDLSDSIGVPNACTGCHTSASNDWANKAILSWTRRVSHPVHWATALSAGRRQVPGAASSLATLSRDASAPPIVRATALSLLGNQLDRKNTQAVLDGLEDESALVRMAAVGATESMSSIDRERAIVPLLRDPARAVRIDAARLLASVRGQLQPRPAAAFERALAEYQRAQNRNADRPEAHVNLGILYSNLGQIPAARSEFEKAIRIGRYFLPAYVNLADIHRIRRRDDEGEQVLNQALEQVPDSPEVLHALGLLRVRQKRLDEALPVLARAAELVPRNPRYSYVYGIALHSAGETSQAIDFLEAAALVNPGAGDLFLAISTIQRDMGRHPDALDAARRLLAVRPDDPAAAALVRELEKRPAL
ncbi:MAG: tetratricopeptide repeat protein [Deltaproteobacteria bacterium]|nr:MAG: tetratricopeptide repeat protein [Deltaproteobacteria bacterium]